MKKDLVQLRDEIAAEMEKMASVREYLDREIEKEAFDVVGVAKNIGAVAKRGAAKAIDTAYAHPKATAAVAGAAVAGYAAGKMSKQAHINALLKAAEKESEKEDDQKEDKKEEKREEKKEKEISKSASLKSILARLEEDSNKN